MLSSRGIRPFSMTSAVSFFCVLCFSYNMGALDPKMMRRYLPAAVVPRLQLKDSLWASELRQVTVVFANLGLAALLDRMRQVGV